MSSTLPCPAPQTPEAATLIPPMVRLHQLAAKRLTLGDALALLPATIISMVFNAGFVLVLIWYNAGAATGQPVKLLSTAEEQTKVAAQESAEHEIIDVRSEELLTAPPAAADSDPIIIRPDAAADMGRSEPDSSLRDLVDPRDALPGLFIEAPPGLPGPTGPGMFGPGGGVMGGRGTEAFDLRNNPSGNARRGGGNDASEKAVLNGLFWLAAHQAPDGKWSLDKYHTHDPQCRCKDLTFEAAVQSNDTAGTALALLPFLGAGHHHKKNSTFRGHVFKGLNALISRQERSGDLKGGMYGHGLATIVLCEAYGMSADAKLRVAAQKAIDFIVYAQNDQTGGWHYAPKGVGDTSVVGWQVMALRSGQMAGLNVPSKTLEGARKWLDIVARESGAKYAYNKDTAPTPAMTAVGLLNRQYLGWGPRNPELHRGCEYLLTNLPQAKPTPNETLGPIYYYYYASQVMHHMEGRYFETWNPPMRDKLIRLQEHDGHKAGSWSPVGTDYGKDGGRIYATALSILTLEVYYRHMPLYRRTEAMMPRP